MRLLLAALAAGLLTPGHVTSQCPGQSVFSANDDVEYVPGTLPILLTAPHGGALKPGAIPDRSYGVVLQDARTQPLTRELRAALEAETGRTPHVVYSHLHRIKLDPNREIVEAAQGDPRAEQAWRDYHGFIEQARATMVRQWGRGLVVDVHGHGHTQDWIEWGYSFTASDLVRSDAELNGTSFVNRSTIRHMATRPWALPHAELLRGPDSLGGRMQALGWQGVPSPQHPDPGGHPYFSGGYSVRRHGSRAGGTVDAVQIEFQSRLRRDVPTRRRMVPQLASVLSRYVEQHLQLDPDRGPRFRVTVVEATATETGSPARFRFERDDPGGSRPAVSVDFVIGGTATRDVDYTLPAGTTNRLEFPEGELTVELTVTPAADALPEGDETVVVQVCGGVQVGYPARAELVLQDEPNEDPDRAGEWLMDQISAGTTPDRLGRRPAVLEPSAASGPQSVPGRIDGALLFDRVDDRLRIRDFDYQDAGDFTLAFWFRGSRVSGSALRYVFSHGAFNAPSSLNVWFSESSGKLRTHLRYDNAATPSEHLDIETDLLDGAWHHYAFVADRRGGTSTVYVDGEVAAEGVFGGDRFDPSGDVFLGARQDLSASRYFGGALDGLVLTARALSSAEVRSSLFERRPGRVDDYGVGCAGVAGIPRVAFRGTPDIDRRFEFELIGASAQAPCFLSVGLSRSFWAGRGLPFDLGTLGAPGCWLLNDLADALRTTADGAGRAAVSVAVPRVPSAVGRMLYGQYLVLDRANRLGLVTTRGLEVRLGGSVR